MTTPSNPLIAVFAGSIANESSLLVNARDLHAFLKVGKRFASWITERINEYGFVDNQDFMSFSQNGEKPQGGRPTREYHLTLDMAKELAMVERNEKGRIIRRYFIECEKQLRVMAQAAINPHFRTEYALKINYPLESAAPPLGSDGLSYYAFAQAKDWIDPGWELLMELRKAGFNVDGPIYSHQAKMHILKAMYNGLIEKAVENMAVATAQLKYAPVYLRN